MKSVNFNYWDCERMTLTIRSQFCTVWPDSRVWERKSGLFLFLEFIMNTKEFDEKLIELVKDQNDLINVMTKNQKILIMLAWTCLWRRLSGRLKIYKWRNKGFLVCFSRLWKKWAIWKIYRLVPSGRWKNTRKEKLSWGST